MGAPLSQRAPAAVWMCAGRELGLLAAKPVMRISTRYMPFPSGVIVELPDRPGSRFSVTLIGTVIVAWACAAVAAVKPSTTAASSAAPLFQPIRTRMDDPPTSLRGLCTEGHRWTTVRWADVTGFPPGEVYAQTLLRQARCRRDSFEPPRGQGTARFVILS